MELGLSDWTIFQWFMFAFGAIAALGVVSGLLIRLLTWRKSKHLDSDPAMEFKRLEPYQVYDFPVIHATSGVPSIAQLMGGMHLDAKKSLLARHLYEIGLKQFNHYVNNRDGVIEESRKQTANLVDGLSETEIRTAEEIGKSLATIKDSEELEAKQAQYKELTPQAQIYAQYRRQEMEAIKGIARDLETNTPRTDYSSVKEQIASGNVKLESVLSELPVAWQDIRTLSERNRRPRISGKPPKLERIRLIVVTRDRGLLEDHGAEIDGNWIVSDKLDITVPHEESASIFETVREGTPPVWKGEVVVITNSPSSEWITEYWRRGGRRDEEYRRALNGTSPKQLRIAQRTRLLASVAWAIAGVDIGLPAALLALQWLEGLA